LRNTQNETELSESQPNHISLPWFLFQI